MGTQVLLAGPLTSLTSLHYKHVLAELRRRPADQHQNDQECRDCWSRWKYLGSKYMFLSATDRVVRAKKGTSGVHCIKTVQALIVCVYEDPVVPEQAATVTEKLGEYLISVGY